MVQRSQTRDHRQPHPVSGALSGLLFSKYQNGGDWTQYPDRYKFPIDLKIREMITHADEFSARARALGRQISAIQGPQHYKYRIALRSQRRELKTRASVLRYNAMQSLAYAKMINANARNAKILGRRLRKEENHNYTMNLLSGSYGVGDIFNANGLMIQSNASVLDYFGLVEPPQCWDANDTIALANKLASKLQEHVDLNVAVTAAEIDKNMDAISGAAKKIVRSAKKLISGDYLGAMRILANSKNTSANLGSTRKNAASSQKWLAQGSPVRDRYLQWQLGVVPLVQDAEAAVRAIAWLMDRPQYQKFSARRKRTANSVVSSTSGYYASKRMVTGQLVAILKSLPSAADVLGVYDLPSGLWERLYLSFVFDWWIPVGGYLEALAAKRLFSQAMVVQTITTRTWKEVESSQVKGLTFTANFPTKEYRVQVQRTCGVGLSVDLPVMKPLFHQKAEVRRRHTLESIALMHGMAEKINDRIVREEKQLAAVKRMKRFKGRWAI